MCSTDLYISYSMCARGIEVASCIVCCVAINAFRSTQKERVPNPPNASLFRVQKKAIKQKKYQNNSGSPKLVCH